MAIHGGDIYSEGLLKGRDILDYSSNINPFGVPSLLSKNIDELLLNAVRYPDIEYREVKENLIEYNHNYFNIKLMSEELILGNGAAEIIDLAIKPLDKILIIAPSFAEYEVSAKRYNIEITYSYLNKDMEFNYQDMLLKLKQCEGIIITNPNNPNGNIIDKDKFKELLNYAQENKKIVIIDEAFIEMTEFTNSLVSFTKEYTCLFIIRAITKFFGLPGVRFGYGITSNKEYINKLRGEQLPWNINSFAELSVKYALKDSSYIEKSKKWLACEIQRFIEEIRKCEIIDNVYNTHSNFCLCKLKNIDEDMLYNYFFKNNIAIRKCSNFKGLDKSYVRFAIKDKVSNDKFLQVLRSYK